MNEFKVGLLALVTIVVTAYMSFRVTSHQSGFGKYTTYKTVITDASGIFPKTPIKIAGINAGRIRKIELIGNKAHIFFEVLSNIKIKENSVLKIKSVGFLGDKFLEIYVGDHEDVLRENAYIISEEGAGMENVLRDTSIILEDVKYIVKGLKESLSPPGQKPPLKQILEDVNDLVSSMSNVANRIDGLVGLTHDDLSKILTNFKEFSKDLAFELNRDKSGSSITKIDEILKRAEESFKDMNVVISNLKNGRGTIGKFLVEDEIAQEVKETLSGVKKIVNRVQSVRTELSVYTGVGYSGGSLTNASMKVYPSPERFYFVGASTSQYGPEDITHETKINKGVTDTTINKTKKENTFVINAQLGRTIQNWSFRGGIFESTGGLGVDYDLKKMSARLTFDLFDYRQGLGPNVRLGSEFKLWNVFYGKLVFDDLAFDSRSASVSGGIRFNDEDLKGLIGFFF